MLDELYTIIGELRRRLDLPETRQGTRLFEMLTSYAERLQAGGFFHFVDDLAETNPDLNELAMEAFNVVRVSVREVTEDGVSPEDVGWKNTTIHIVKSVLDAFLATRPPPTVNGGRRRKTRKGKSRRLRRSRYSRRR